MKVPVNTSPRNPLLRMLLLAALGIGTSSATTATYRYYRFRTTAVRGNTLLVQLAEIKLFNGGVQVTGAVASDPAPGSYPTNEAPVNAVDGIVTPPTGGTKIKWLDYDYTKGRLILDFGSPKAIDSYNFYTANDSPDRDPISWVLEGSNDDPTINNWIALDVVQNASYATTRYGAASATNFALPVAVKASIDEFGFSDPNASAIMLNGATPELVLDTAQASSSTLTSTGAEAPVTNISANDAAYVTVHPDSNRITTYTLTALSQGGNATSTLTLRTVAGATLNYRYLRYTPTAVVKGSAINLSDFEFSLAGAQVPVAAVETQGGTVITGKEVANLIDDPFSTSTTWASSSLTPVIFDFGASPVQYDGYSFWTGTDINAAPVQWTMEGSNDKTTWTLVDNVPFNFNPPKTASSPTAVIPFSGTSLIPYAGISTDAKVSAAGEAVTLSWKVLGAASATISPGIGTVSGTGSMTVTPTTTTTYTIATNGSGTSGQGSTTLTVVPSIPASFTYANFNEHADIKPVGFTSFLNDFTHFTAAGNVSRLRLTDSSGSEQSAAWYGVPVKVSEGFDTTFDAFIANMSTYVGADGMAFVIQNTADGTATPNTGSLYLTNNSISIALDSYPDQTYENGKYASLEIFQNDTRLAIVDLTSTGTVGKNVAHGLNHNYLCDYNNAAATPYHVHVVYTGSKLSVTIDNVLVVDGLAVSLGDAGVPDAKGRAYVGFFARTGGLSETHDITAWSFTSSSATVPSVPLAITGSSFNNSAHTLALTWSSTSGKSYRVTQSADMVNWSQVPGSGNVVASSASSSATVTFTAAAKGFFRVEEVSTP